MSSAPNANPAPTEPQEWSVAAGGVLSYVIPGLGQIYQGRFGKGFLFMVSLLGMFILGQAMGNWQNVYLPRPASNRPGRGVANVVDGTLALRRPILDRRGGLAGAVAAFR